MCPQESAKIDKFDCCKSRIMKSLLIICILAAGIGILSLLYYLPEGKAPNLYLREGTLHPHDSVWLTIGQSGFRLDPYKVKVTSLEVKDGSGKQCPWSTTVVPQSQMGPILKIFVDTRGTTGSLHACGVLDYKGFLYDVEAAWQESPTSWWNPEWELRTGTIVP